MPKYYVLNEKDNRNFKQLVRLRGRLTSGPLQRRRRGSSSTSNTSTTVQPIITGLLVASIPAAEWLDECIVQDEWDQDMNDYALTDPPGSDEEQLMIGGINGDPHQSIRGSETVPVRVWGLEKYFSVEIGEVTVLKKAIEIFRWSMVQLPGHDESSRQGPFKPEDTHASQMGGGPCDIPAE